MEECLIVLLRMFGMPIQPNATVTHAQNHR